MLAPSPSQQSEQLPYGLVSLWDMLNFHAAKLFEVINCLADIERTLTFDPARLCNGSPDLSPILAQQLRWLSQQTKALGLPVTHTAAKNAVWGAENGKNYNHIEVGNLMRSSLAKIRERLQDELETKSVYLIPSKSHLQEIDGAFGEPVSIAFPSAVYDIVEAGKCLTFSRSTACVMHLMRVLEVGLVALATQLGVDASGDNWNTILNRIEGEIRSRTKESHGEEWKTKEEPFYAEVATHFRFLKNGWRNHAMHARAKYTEEEADEIYLSVRALMRHLSERLSEVSPGA